MSFPATENGADTQAAFRREVRAFLDETLTVELREAAAMQPGVFAEGRVREEWHRLLFEKGWIAPAWPAEYGGPGWSPMQRMIFEAECAAAAAPVLPGMALQMCGPVLMRFGTQAQKDFFLPRILSGEHFWCQGYSEPQAGSDLASLQCSAVRDGDDYIIDGTKIWTTFAHYANWIFLLVRTSREGRKQEGITFLLAPMDSPGLSVQPIRSMSGDHEVNQIFFDGVRVPIANRVGEENQGWAIAKYLLEFERGGGWASGRVRRVLALLDAAESEAETAHRPFGAEGYSQKRAALEIDILALEWTQRRYVAATETGESIGDASASMLKLVSSELFQRASELALDAMGERGAIAFESQWVTEEPDHARSFAARYLNGRAMTIFGGASEIQRTVIARTALGL